MNLKAIIMYFSFIICFIIANELNVTAERSVYQNETAESYEDRIDSSIYVTLGAFEILKTMNIENSKIFERNFNRTEKLIATYESEIIKIGKEVLHEILIASKDASEDFLSILDSISTIIKEICEIKITFDFQTADFFTRFKEYPQIFYQIAENITVVNIFITYLEEVSKDVSNTFDSSDHVYSKDLLTTLKEMKQKFVQFSYDLSDATDKIITMEADDEDKVTSVRLWDPPCGTFLPINFSNEKHNLHHDGFSAGLFWDGSQAFIGTGNINYSDGSKYLTPGRINIHQQFLGVFMAAEKEMFDNRTVNYLVKHPQLKWIDYTWKENDRFHPKAIQIVNFQSKYAVGRYNISGHTNVGKVMVSNGFSFTINGTIQKRVNFELLICDE